MTHSVLWENEKLMCHENIKRNIIIIIIIKKTEESFSLRFPLFFPSYVPPPVTLAGDSHSLINPALHTERKWKKRKAEERIAMVTVLARADVQLSALLAAKPQVLSWRTT